jgi:hypothetical protein
MAFFDSGFNIVGMFESEYIPLRERFQDAGDGRIK